MKPTKSLLVLAFLLVPGVAAAQGYYGGSGPGYYNQPSQIPGGFHDRTGRIKWGGSFGLGFMDDRGSNITACVNCNYNPLAIQLDGHIGGMLSPRLALMGEFQLNAQTIYADYWGDSFLNQTALMVAIQYWVSPQLWVKGGIGFAHLLITNPDYRDDIDIGSGSALMGAIGYEIMSAPNFAVDLQGRLIKGTYNGFGDHITSGTVGIGVSFY
jgi:hypothetical protein